MGEKQLNDLFNLFKEKHQVKSRHTDFDKEFCKRLMKASNASEASIWRIEADGRLRLKYGSNINPDELENFSFKPGEGISGAAILSRKAISVTDAWSEPQHNRIVDSTIRFRTRSMISTPVIHDGQVYGVINILNYTFGNSFPKEWEILMTSIGILYGTALLKNQDRESMIKVHAARMYPDKSQTVFVGISRGIQDVLSLSMKAAKSQIPVLIYGETGTGKELAARRIHENMDESEGRFLSINCAALNETILESELFGHVKGAFSGAESNRKGKFVAASGGTLFLDEIGEMSLSCQAKILRALQEKKVMPVGSDKEVAYDARIIAATNMNLEKQIEQGKFRQDLYFRLCGLEVRIPTLQDRKSDIPLLVDFFVQKHQDSTGKATQIVNVSPPALDLLLAYPWPGNVRQLEQAIMAALAVSNSTCIEKEDLPGWLIRSFYKKTPDGISMAEERNQNRFQGDKLRYHNVLEETKYKGTGRWNISAAARKLKIPRKTFIYRIKKMNLTQS